MKQSSGKDRQPQKGKNRQRRPQAISNRAYHAQKKSSDGKNRVGKYSSSKPKAYHGDRDYSGRVRFKMNKNQLRAMVAHAMVTARRGEAGHDVSALSHSATGLVPPVSILKPV